MQVLWNNVVSCGIVDDGRREGGKEEGEEGK